MTNILHQVIDPNLGSKCPETALGISQAIAALPSFKPLLILLKVVLFLILSALQSLEYRTYELLQKLEHLPCIQPTLFQFWALYMVPKFHWM